MALNETSSEQDTASPKLRLFDVTLQWDVDNRGLGDYSSRTWATSRDEAVRVVAEEMVDSGEIKLPDEDSPDYRSARDRAIQRILRGKSTYSAIDVGARILGEILEIMEGHDGAAQGSVAVKTDYAVVSGILKKYIPA